MPADRIDARRDPQGRGQQIKAWFQQAKSMDAQTVILNLEKAINTLLELTPESPRRAEAQRYADIAFETIADVDQEG